jgi:hypothetical protein
MLQFTPWSLPALAVFFGGFALAWFIYRSRPDRRQNQLLALQIACEAVAVGLIGGLQWVFTDARVVSVLGYASLFVVWPKLWTYYSFLATLDTPLARPLTPRVLRGLLIATLLAASSVIIRPDWYGGETHYWPAVRGLHMPPGTAFMPILWMWAIMWIVGLSFSVSALRQARTEIRREQARAYLIAFGFRDVAFFLSAVLFTVVPPTARYFHVGFLLAFPVTWLIYYPLVAWGILRHQLFDIELRVKRGVQRSVVAAAITGAFFVGAYALEQFININNFVLGLLTAGIVTATLQPLQRLAAKVADRLMPGVDAGSERYLAERRHEVYRNAIEAAMQDGSVTARERAILARLRESLAVSAAEAAGIEAEVQRTLAAGSAVLAPAFT